VTSTERLLEIADALDEAGILFLVRISSGSFNSRWTARANGGDGPRPFDSGLAAPPRAR